MKANTSSPDRRVTTIDDLIAACRDTGARRVIVNGTLENAPSIRLAPGQALLGEDDHGSIAFAHGVDGLQLTTDNQVSGLRLTASPDKRVIFNDTQVAGLGRMRLAGITAIGQVQILVREGSCRCRRARHRGRRCACAQREAARLRRVRPPRGVHALEYAAGRTCRHHRQAGWLVGGP